MSLAALDSRFPKKRAVITGGASGPGFAAAELLASHGWKFALLDRDGSQLTAAARDLPGGATHIVLPGSYRWLWRFKRLAPRSFLRQLTGFRQRGHSSGG